MPRWRHVRGVLVLLHVVAVLVLAVPTLRAGLDRSSWRSETVRAELRAWARRLGTTPDVLEERAFRFARSWSRLRTAVGLPFEPYRQIVGIRQPWVMFVAPHRYPARFEIEIEEEGAWRTIYRARSEEHTWRRRLFDHDRMRSAMFRYGWERYRGAYHQLADWVRDEAARDFPGATRVRLRMYRYRTPSPQEAREGRTPSGTYEHQIVYRLEGRAKP